MFAEKGDHQNKKFSCSQLKYLLGEKKREGEGEKGKLFSYQHPIEYICTY